MEWYGRIYDLEFGSHFHWLVTSVGFQEQRLTQRYIFTNPILLIKRLLGSQNLTIKEIKFDASDWTKFICCQFWYWSPPPSLHIKIETEQLTRCYQGETDSDSDLSWQPTLWQVYWTPAPYMSHITLAWSVRQQVSRNNPQCCWELKFLDEEMIVTFLCVSPQIWW